MHNNNTFMDKMREKIFFIEYFKGNYFDNTS